MTIIQAVAGIGQPADPNFKNVALLLKDNGTNGAQNNTFLDSSSNNFTITRNGDTTQGAFTPYVPDGYWSNYFNGAGDFITIPNSTTLQVPTEDFTFECFVFLTAVPTDLVTILFGKGATVDSNAEYRLVINNSSGVMYLRGSYSTTGIDFTSINATSNPIPFNKWCHLALTRTGGTAQLWVDGVATTLDTTAWTTSGFSGTGTARVGASATGTSSFPGYVSNLRFVKGTVLYTANFTPPTAPLTAVTNTSLLTCQSNRFIDNSSNAFTLTTTGTPQVSAFQPFPKTSIYSPTAYGGSAYFDGAGDYLTIGANTAFDVSTSNFTVEFWLYSTVALSNYQRIFTFKKPNSTGVTNEAMFFEISTSGISIGAISGSTQVGAATAQSFAPNRWYHLALVRNGSNVTAYINGVSVGSGTLPGNVNYASDYSITIGAWVEFTTFSRFITGYISGFRFLKGTALYTANFTPPSSPVTNITNTSLLCNFTNAGIFDATTINDLQTVGNAQASTTQAKWGATSLYFDGTGDYLVLPDNPLWDLRGDFTIETWVYLTNYSSSYVGQYGVCIVANYFYIAGSSNQGWQLRINGTASAYNVINVYTGTTDLNFTSATVNLNTWTHIAISRSGSSIRAFVNGTQVGSTITNSDTFTEANSRVLRVGQLNDANYLFPMIGYLQDLRITPGIARYTANFTPPVAPFPPR